MTVDVSIAVPTFNRSKDLLGLLHSLIIQKADFAYEVIVLDNACDPALEADIGEVKVLSDMLLRYVPVPDPGLHNGRHVGAKQAQSDILVYVDDDIIAAPGWLQSIAEAFRNPDVHLVGGRSLPQYESEPPNWLEAFWSHSPDGQHFCGHLSLVDLGDKPFEVDPNYIWGLNFAIRKRTLEKLGGFNPDGMPWALRCYRGDGESAVTRKAKALGLKAVYRPDALVYHRIPQSRLTVEYFERRAFLQGISDSFTHIRQAGRVEPSPQLASQPELLRKRLKQIIHKLPYYARHPVQHGRNFVQRRLAGAAPGAAEGVVDEIAAIKARVDQAYRAGYAFHRDAVAGDAELLAWVLREDYWDYRLPELQSPAYYNMERVITARHDR